MAEDPVQRLAKLRIIKASADLDVQFSVKRADRPSIEILRLLRDAAATSLAAMVFLNLDDPADLIKCKVMQNEVKRYDEWVGWLRQIVNEGRELDRQMSDDERNEMLDILMSTGEGQEEAIALGLVDPNKRGAEE
jgi:hypothetical protein